VERIRAGTSHAYVVVCKGRALLIDAGNRRKGEVILKGLCDRGVRPTAVELIIPTHTHFDHVGSLSFLKDATGAKVLVHEKEAASLRQGYTEIPRGTMSFTRLASLMGRTYFRWIARYRSVEADVTIAERYELSDFGIPGQVLPTPGHTAGSVSIVIGGYAAFVGDAMVGYQPFTVFPPFADDGDAVAHSWSVLLESGAELFLPAHGAAVSRRRLHRCMDDQSRP
ncbi:MAG: MBL fold metallo-hydrolase, partial [Smithellaceae bacterium]|nr:MBL fold metallo-hydrolase [Smithellaceae bacterium]